MALTLAAQDANILDTQGIRQAMAAESNRSAPVDATPKASGSKSADSMSLEKAELALKASDREKRSQEIKALKFKEGGPRRFAEDLFETREELSAATEGGISEDYVLGIGDELQVSGFGSASFDLPSAVNGRGEINLPKVGPVKVSGLTLGRAKAAIQGKITQQLAGTTVDVSVVKLREVRIFVMGEVYKSGSYLVPSLSSAVNVLGLAGGPTALGSYRQIRIMRGGRVLHQVDLYPLRADGLGNLNFSFQTGDTVFVPLNFNTVLLEGGFLRVAGRNADLSPDGSRENANRTADGLSFDKPQQEPKQKENDPGQASPQETHRKDTQRDASQTAPDAPSGNPLEKNLLENSLPRTDPGALPSMSFEFLPGETAKDVLHFAGGLLPKAYADGLTLRRLDPGGVTSVADLPMERLEAFELKSGDVLGALPRRDRIEALVSVSGWVRVPGTFARTEGLRVGDLLKHQAQVMPDTYLRRGEILRTLEDGSTRFLSFDVGKALQGDAASNLLLENRDKVELHRIDRLKLTEHVTLSGPFTQAGVYDFHRGMRVADLIFKAGIPEKRANCMVAELARSRGGQPSEILKLDLAKLISTEAESPVNFADDNLNPLLRDDDEISVYEKPEFRVHRSVRVGGQVAKPGLYVLDVEHPTLSHLIERAGGLLPDAMPKAGIFFRNPGQAANSLAGLHVSDTSGITDILERLNETKVFNFSSEVKTTNGSQPPIFKIPVLHGMMTGKLNRVVVDFPDALAGKPGADIEVLDQDEIVIPKRTDTAMVIGETAAPFAFYRVTSGMKVRDLLKMAGGTTRNADTSNIRLLKADGRIQDEWVKSALVEPGDALLVPQVVNRATTWQDNLNALTPLAILLNAIRQP